MIEKRHKLRLRKQVIVAFALAFILFSGIFGLIIKNNKLNANVVKRIPELETSHTINDINSLDYKYVYEIENAILNRKRDNTVVYYAKKFKLNVNKTLELVHTFTENYTKELYLKTYWIGPEKVVENFKDPFKEEEAGIAYFVRDLYRYPEKYETSIEEIRLPEEITNEKNVKEGIVYVQNGLTYEQYLGYICDLFNVDKSTVLAISYMETRYLKSPLFVNKNNVGGQRGYSGWLEYPTLEAGIIGHVLSIRAMLNNYEIDLEKENAISHLSSIYVNGHPNNPDAHWTEKVTLIRENIREKDLFSIE